MWLLPSVGSAPGLAVRPAASSHSCLGTRGPGGHVPATCWAGREVRGLFTQSFGAQRLGQCLCSAWHPSLWRPSWLRRVKVGIDCPVTAGGYCLTGAGANISYLSEIKKKVCGSCSLMCLQPTFGKAEGWAPFYHGSVCCFLVKPAWSSLLQDQAC